MIDSDSLEALEQGAEALENTLTSASAVTKEFSNNVEQMQDKMGKTSKDVERLSGSISSGLRQAIKGLIFDGDKLSDALK